MSLIGMTLRVAACVGMLCIVAPAVNAQSERIEAGLWKVTTNLVMNGNPMPVEVKNRCLTAEQAGDLAGTFGPEVTSVNTECKSERAFKDGRLKWMMQCRGQIDIDVSGDFTFDNAKHYSATVATKAFMGGRKVADSSAAIEGEHSGTCP
jgi:hypothetical protein